MRVAHAIREFSNRFNLHSKVSYARNDFHLNKQVFVFNYRNSWLDFLKNSYKYFTNSHHFGFSKVLQLIKFHY